MKALARKHLRDVIALVGIGWVVAGVWHLYAVAGMIALGAGMVAVAVMLPEPPPDGPGGV